MKHQHEVRVDILDATVDAEKLIDKITDSVITIIAVSTVAHILKSLIK